MWYYSSLYNWQIDTMCIIIVSNQIVCLLLKTVFTCKKNAIVFRRTPGLVICNTASNNGSNWCRVSVQNWKCFVLIFGLKSPNAFVDFQHWLIIHDIIISWQPISAVFIGLFFFIRNSFVADLCPQSPTADDKHNKFGLVDSPDVFFVSTGLLYLWFKEPFQRNLQECSHLRNSEWKFTFRKELPTPQRRPSH